MIITDSFMKILTVLVVLAVMIALIFLIRVLVKTEYSRDIDYISVGIISNLLSSDLTDYYGVFDKNKLDDINGKSIEPVMSCMYAYNVTIKAENGNGYDSWHFGYWSITENDDRAFKTEDKRVFKMPVIIKDGISKRIGMMTIEIRKDDFTKLTCAIMTANEIGKAEFKPKYFIYLNTIHYRNILMDNGDIISKK